MTLVTITSKDAVSGLCRIRKITHGLPTIPIKNTNLYTIVYIVLVLRLVSISSNYGHCSPSNHSKYTLFTGLIIMRT